VDQSNLFQKGRARHAGAMWRRFAAAGLVTGCFSLGSVVAFASTGSDTSFVDGSAIITKPENVTISPRAYIGPFAKLIANKRIIVGDTTNVQDNVTVDASDEAVELGGMVILAHGATVKNGTKFGTEGHCPAPAADAHGGHSADADMCPSFLGFNAEVDGAIIEKDTMVMHLARVGPGVRIPSGRKVPSGFNITSQDQVMTRTIPLVAGDHDFMEGVIHVNSAFADTYAKMHAEDASNSKGINYDAGNADFNPFRELPTLNGVRTRDPNFRNRIIGDVRMADTKEALDKVMGDHDAIRADEGDPFEVGTIAKMGNEVTFHALEHTHVRAGHGVVYGHHVVVHGGPTPWNDVTEIGDGTVLGDGSVFFRSRVGKHSYIGPRALLQQSDQPAGTVIPDLWIVVENKWINRVEW
jgi:carbonic anhydrase/acetyltransferase-like protein (isoleucine patch superfamily)